MMSDRKKILIVSDDIRVPTGVSIMTKTIIEKTSDRFEWVQYGALKIHPNDKDVSLFEGIKIYGAERFGNEKMFRVCIEKENPDAVLFFTDPRQFTHLFQTEYDIRKKIPWMYYTIWDNEPAPHFNKPFYESCDGIFCISRLTEEVVTEVLGVMSENKVLKYIPHGVDQNIFVPMDRNEPNFQKKVLKIFDFDPFEYDFVVLWSNKNMDRKKPQDAMLAFDRFMIDSDLDDKNALMIMNTNPISDSGGDLYQFKYDHLKNPHNIKFVQNGTIVGSDLPYLYNIADVLINNSDNEGWGLAVTEAKMCGIPVIATNIGGIKDQIMADEENIGAWAFPLFPKVKNFIGSPVADYIYESRYDIDDITDHLTNLFHDYNYEDLKNIGILGREHAIRMGHTSDMMTKMISDSIEETINSFSPREKLKIKRF